MVSDDYCDSPTWTPLLSLVFKSFSESTLSIENDLMNDQLSEYNISTLRPARIQKRGGENPERISKETY